MKTRSLFDSIQVPKGSSLSSADYENFLLSAYYLLSRHPLYMSNSESPEVLELAHLIPGIPETVLAIYVGINDAVCNKGLVTPFLPRHAHNNVFVFDPQEFPGGPDVPAGTVDARSVIHGFTPPNPSWDPGWTYVMIRDPARNPESLWKDKGYIDMIPAKFEDFTMMSDHDSSRLCTFIDPVAFGHPVNRARDYLKAARDRGEALAGEFRIPEALRGETGGLVPVVLRRGEKLYVARPDSQPCDHCWSNLHEANRELAVVNENSAIPLHLVSAKPPLAGKYRDRLVPPSGSADSTTDWFFRGKMLFRKPVKEGQVKG
jgi:hypothetical protein